MNSQTYNYRSGKNITSTPPPSTNTSRPLLANLHPGPHNICKERQQFGEVKKDLYLISIKMYIKGQKRYLVDKYC